MTKRIAATDQRWPDRSIRMGVDDPILLTDPEGDPIRITLRADGVWQIACNEPKGREDDPDGNEWQWVNVAEV